MEPTFTVSELARSVASALDRAFAGELWVEGEIRDLRRPPAGHVYFTLTDPDDDSASLPVSLFAVDRGAVNRVLMRSGAMRMTDGVHVRIRGRIGFHAARSTVRLRMTWIDTDYTIGRMAADRQAVLRRLEAAGLLDRNAAIVIPPLPLRVGLVTSVGSAAHADFLSELTRSSFGFQVIVTHARVQGREAPADLVAALEALPGQVPDVVAVVRGGGAQTDLAAFDTEAVAAAIGSAPFPVFTGIGHEIDLTVADRVAARSFKTPTACADGIVALVRRFDERLRVGAERLGRLSAAGLADAEAELHRRIVRAERSGRRGVATAEGGLSRRTDRIGRAAAIATDEAARRLSAAGSRTIVSGRHRIGSADAAIAAGALRLRRRTPRPLQQAMRRVAALEAIMRAQEPSRILARGWSITRRADGSLVRRPDQVAPGDPLVTTTAGGPIESTVVGDGTVVGDSTIVGQEPADGGGTKGRRA